MAAAAASGRRDVLRDGAPYRIVIPPRWNGTLLLTMDFVGPPGARPAPLTSGCSGAATRSRERRG